MRGTTPVWELLPQVVAAVAPLPVLASGGIGDGAGLACALRLGAQGQRPGEGIPIGTLVRSSGERIDWPRYAVGVAGPDFNGDIEDAPLWAGESCTVVNDIKPAAQIVRDLVAEAEVALGLFPGPAPSG